MSKPIMIVTLFLLILGTFVFAAAVSADPITINTTGTINTSQTTSVRIFRDGTATDCSGEAFPGPFGSGPYGYTIEGVFGPVSADDCITVTWDPLLCGTNAHPIAFRNSFDPAWGPDNATNYLGDAGSSAAGTFSFPVLAGDSFVIVFTNTSSLASCDYSYSLTYDGAVPSAIPVIEGCTLAVPAGSVVGDTPYNAQVYYEPGNVSPGIFLNPGTYIVTGMDESGEYYQIMLACSFVWVRKETMQPSYDPPQNGSPLPTGIVGGTSSSTTGAAQD